MLRKDKCVNCKQPAEFETDGQTVSLIEQVQGEPTEDEYYVDCPRCGAQNRILVPRSKT